MEADIWRKLPCLIEDFLSNAARYEFFQAVRLLESMWDAQDAGSHDLDDWLRMRSAPEISFPAADIRRCGIDANGRLDMELNFMGLYGVDAPVPNYFIEHIAREDEQSRAMRAFLDIFTHRMYTQLYMAWKKYRPVINPDSTDSRYAGYLAALSGSVLRENESMQLGFSGLMGARVRGADALAGMLSEYLDGIPVSIRQFVPRWVRLDQDSALGKEDAEAMFLGDNTILGGEVLDVSGKIEVIIGSMNIAQAQDLLPGGSRVRQLVMMLKHYLCPTVIFDFVFKVQPETVVAKRLGEEGIILGWVSWLGTMPCNAYELHIPGDSLLPEPAVQETGAECPRLLL